MAKKRNHYIPRILLSRFASRRDGDKAWVWQVRPNVEPIEVSVRDVAVATYFYGKPQTGVEDQLSEDEMRMTAILDSIEDGASPAEHDCDLRHWIHTLAIRTRHVRDAFVESASNLLEEMIASVDSDVVREAGRAYAEANLDGILLDVLTGLPTDQRSAILNALQQYPDGWVRLRSWAMQLASQFDLGKGAREFMLNARPFIKPDEAAKEGQIKGLSKVLSSSRSEIPIAVDSWHVIRADSDQFVLGDSCVFSVDERGNAFPLLAGPEDSRELYLPVSRQCMVVGLRGSDKPILAIPEITLAAARVSRDALFASRLDQSIVELSKIIGVCSSYLRTGSIGTLVQEVWEEMRKNPRVDKNEPSS